VSITQFITNNYNILFQGSNVDPNKLDAVEEFILTDDHACLGTQQIHSQFINTYFNLPGSKVYVESQPLGAELDDKVKQIYWINNDLIVEGWDIGTIEGIFAKGILNLTKSHSLDIVQITSLFQTLQLSNNNAVKLKLTIKNFIDSDKKSKSREVAKKELKNVIIESKKVHFNDTLLFQVVDSTFLERQLSLVNACNRQGRKVIVVGELHVYKKDENSTSIFDTDPNLNHGQIGRALIQNFVKNRNAVVLKPKPGAVHSVYQKEFASLMIEAAKLVVDESEEYSNTGSFDY
jgi:hypothetical protein